MSSPDPALQEILQTRGLGRFSLTDLDGWLRGSWTLERVINGGAGTFTGTACFAPAEPATLVWRETGHLTLPPYEGPASRTLHIAPAGEAWEVRFDDGRPFHALDLSDGRCVAAHHCGPDVYRGEYLVHDDDRFTVTWRVEGPRKRDVIVSGYARAA